MTTRQTILAVLAVVAVGAMLTPPARAQDSNFNRRTVLTFSHPFEIPGMVLPAGTYTFQLADTLADRHIVSISSADGLTQIAMAMGIAINRIDPTNRTVVTFNEVPVGSPDAIRTWFYPGRSGGVEFVYPKRRALELATASNVVVPAIAVDEAEPDLKTVPLVAVTPDRQELPVAAAVENTSPTVESTSPTVEQTQASTALPTERQLPKTASELYLVTVIGLLSLCAAAALLFIRKRHPAAVATI